MSILETDLPSVSNSSDASMVPGPGRGYFQTSQLDARAAAFYRENGFLVVVDALTELEVAEILEETVAICRGKRGAFGEGWGKAPEIGDTTGMTDDEVIRRFLCVHHPHKASEVMLRALSQPSIVKALTMVIGPNVKCMQSMLFIKSAGKPGQAWHQDEDYIPTRDRSLTGAWISLDRATVENGCLWVIPGSHRHGILWPQYPHNDPRFDCAQESYHFPYRDEDAIPVEVPRGGVVVFNGYLLHRSLPNRAKSGFRRALVNHYMSAESFLPWTSTKENKPVAQADTRDIIMVAGTDPYAYKGTTKTGGMYVRPDGMGGCGDGRMTLAEYLEKNQEA